MARNSPLQASKNWLIYRALLAAAATGRRLSLRRARSYGRSFGRLAHKLLAKERAKALKHLAVAFPDAGDSFRANIARAMFEHFGTSLFEICWLPNLHAHNLAEHIEFEGMENLRRAVEIGRGVVLFTGHCGNWEWIPAAVGLSGFQLNTIAREIYDPRINEFIVQARLRYGVRSIGRGSGSSAREMIKTLRTGGILGVLIDQSIKVESADVPFFGHPAPTPIGPAQIAIRSGATAIAGFIERRGERQFLRFEAPIETRRDDDPVVLTASMTAAIERQIRRVPEQWVWMHDRWKRRT